MSRPHRVVIIGGGISGLATAYRLTELSQERQVPVEVQVLEAQPRFGGVISTEQRDAFLLEAGPDAFLTEKPWATALCQRLGLAEQLIPTNPVARRSWVVRGGRLVPVPAGWYLMAPHRLGLLWSSPLLSLRGKCRMALEPWVPARRDVSDESLASFVRRRFGSEALARIGQPMVSGIYTADPDHLSLQAALPQFDQMERQHGSVLRAMRHRPSQDAAIPAASGARYSLFMTLRHGLSSLIDALVAAMPSVHLVTDTPIAAVTRDAVWSVDTVDGRRLEADSVCVAVPAPQAAALVRGFAPALANALSAIRYESVATMNVAYERYQLPRAMEGVGFIAPAVEHCGVIGCTFSSLKFPGRAPASGMLLRAFVGGALQPRLKTLSDSALTSMVLDELERLLRITRQPRWVVIRRFPAAMPQYDVGHLTQVAAIESHVAQQSGFAIAGNGYHGIGLPDCIHQADQAAQRLMEQIPTHGR